MNKPIVAADAGAAIPAVEAPVPLSTIAPEAAGSTGGSTAACITDIAYLADNPTENVSWVGVLYESSEWSDFKLAQELAARDLPVRLIDMERPDAVEAALSCRFLVSRVFASALARGHIASHEHMDEVIERVAQLNLTLINPGRAHAFEVSKRASTEELRRAGIAVPAVYACGQPASLDPATLVYPCVIKPDCGGRSARTAVLHKTREAEAFLATAPRGTVFIVESFERARADYLTRVEIVGGKIAHAHRRSIAANELSSYHFGCTYEPYDDLPAAVRDAAERAAATLSFEVGSFDIIETAEAPVFIDANSVSNVSADCEELLGYDLMAEYADYISTRYQEADLL